MASVGTGALVTALVGSPAQAFITPPLTTPAAATGTLALCVGAQQGATGYIYAEGITPQGTAPAPAGMDLIPSQFTQLLAGSGGLDCRAYPADPGSYQISTYKYPKAPCTPDQTRPNNPAQTPPNGNLPAGECLAKVHHIHIIHIAGAVDSVDSTGTPYLGPGAGTKFVAGTNPTSDGGSTPECATAVTPTPTIGTAACGVGPDGYDYGLEYTTELTSGNLPEDTVIDAQQVTVQVRQGETTEVITHLPDHETADCFPSFDADVNGNTPVCN